MGLSSARILYLNQKRSLLFFLSKQVICYPLYVKCKSKLQCAIEKWFVPIEGTLPMAIIRHYLYLSWLQHYSDTSLASVLDFRDTVRKDSVNKYNATPHGQQADKD